MATTQLITLSGIADTALSATDDARAARDSLLLLATDVANVRDPDEAARAAFVLKELKTFTRQIEDSRADVKAPILDLGKQVDALARELTLNVDAEALRVSRVLGAWQAEQNRKADEARRKAWEREQDIKAEANRKIAEAREKSRTDATFERRADKIEQAAVAAIVEARVAAAAAIPAKPEGLATRKEIKFEVTDAAALYEAAPYLVNLVPNTAAIKSALKNMQPGQNLPGVRHHFEDLTIVR